MDDQRLVARCDLVGAARSRPGLLDPRHVGADVVGIRSGEDVRADEEEVGSVAELRVVEKPLVILEEVLAPAQAGSVARCAGLAPSEERVVAGAVAIQVGVIDQHVVEAIGAGVPHHLWVRHVRGVVLGVSQGFEGSARELVLPPVEDGELLVHDLDVARGPDRSGGVGRGHLARRRSIPLLEHLRSGRLAHEGYRRSGRCLLAGPSGSFGLRPFVRRLVPDQVSLVPQESPARREPAGSPGRGQRRDGSGPRAKGGIPGSPGREAGDGDEKSEEQGSQQDGQGALHSVVSLRPTVIRD